MFICTYKRTYMSNPARIKYLCRSYHIKWNIISSLTMKQKEKRSESGGNVQILNFIWMCRAGVYYRKTPTFSQWNVSLNHWKYPSFLRTRLRQKKIFKKKTETTRNNNKTHSIKKKQHNMKKKISLHMIFCILREIFVNKK